MHNSKQDLHSILLGIQLYPIPFLLVLSVILSVFSQGTGDSIFYDVHSNVLMEEN